MALPTFFESSVLAAAWLAALTAAAEGAFDAETGALAVAFELGFAAFELLLPVGAAAPVDPVGRAPPLLVLGVVVALVTVPPLLAAGTLITVGFWATGAGALFSPISTPTPSASRSVATPAINVVDADAVMRVRCRRGRWGSWAPDGALELAAGAVNRGLPRRSPQSMQ